MHADLPITEQDRDPTLADLRLRLEYAAEADGKTRIEVSPLEAAELSEQLAALPDIDGELACIRICVGELETIDPDTRNRIVTYLADRFGVPL